MWFLHLIGFVVGCDRMVVKIYICLCNQCPIGIWPQT